MCDYPFAYGLSNNLILFMIFICICAVGFIVIQPIFWNLATYILKGREGAGAIALIGSLGNLGGFVALNINNYFEMQLDSISKVIPLGHRFTTIE